MNIRVAALVALGLLVVVTVAFVVRSKPPAPSSSTLTATQQTATPSPAVSAVPTVSAAAATHAPTNTPSPATATPATAITAKPTPTPTPAKTPAPVPRLSPDHPPEIIAVNISSQAVRPGDVVNGTVVTSSNVASVEAHLATYSIPMHKIGVGKFALSYRVPDLPFFLRGKTYAIDIMAHNTRGDTAHASVPVTVQ